VLAGFAAQGALRCRAGPVPDDSSGDRFRQPASDTSYAKSWVASQEKVQGRERQRASKPDSTLSVSQHERTRGARRTLGGPKRSAKNVLEKQWPFEKGRTLSLGASDQAKIALTSALI